MFEGVKIIVPLGEGRLPLRVARCLGMAGARFVLLSKNRENVARMSKSCARFLYSNPENDAALLDQLQALEATETPEIILPITTEGFQFVSRNRETLQKRFRVPPVASVETLTTASDKWKLYELAVRHDIPVLPSIPVLEIDTAALEHGTSPLKFPALLKSRTREGGAGFQKAESAPALASMIEGLGEDEKYDYLVQPYVDGVDLSLSAFCENGEIKSYCVWGAVSYGKVPYQIPVCIRFAENASALALATRLLKGLNWEGICDIDFFMDKQSGEIFILEVNARFWGNVLGCASRGANFPRLLCERALTQSEPAWPKQTDGIYCYPKGLIRALKKPDARSAILKNPLKTTALDIVLRDPLPEFYKLFLKVKHIVTKGISR
jgi:predicted ATP-grasp superfamily ATP-dependent carboligase